MMCIQEAALASSLGKEEQHILLSSDHTWNELTAEHYETLPGFKFCHQEQSHNPDRQSLAQTISRSKDIDPSTGSNTSGQVSQSNNVINLKSTQADSGNLTLPQSQAWNLPMRNSFTSYSKPLSKVPKGVFS
ncbi:Hypothetical predicted protein [Octopus vulgaris]|uniref:Uncharacterized protein n=1 Tax=Octopus vulgaris TaxID=6645 RepID=A0AA36FBY2_OCTVU|nr:Hypothetical predicted protein [Octopus vulgaris]